MRGHARDRKTLTLNRRNLKSRVFLKHKSKMAGECCAIDINTVNQTVWILQNGRSVIKMNGDNVTIKNISSFTSPQFFTHPVVDTEMKRKWYGRDLIKTEWKRWRALFIFWCLFDLMFSPVLFAVCSLMRRKSRDKTVRGRRSRILSCYGKMDSAKQIIQSSIFRNETVTLHNLNPQSNLRIWKPLTN